MICDRIKTGRSYYGAGNSLFIKECLMEIGGINTSIHWGEDFDWAMRLRNKGYKVVFISSPLYHDTMRTLKEFYKKQFTGARTYTKIGFELMGLSTKDVLYENFVLGTKGMIHGLVVERDISWLLFPVFLFIRVGAYSYTLLGNLIQNRGTKK